VIATGSRPLRLPLEGHDLDGVLELRTAADADRLKAAVAPGVRVCIVGGGYIGLETAAALRALGASPVIVERESRLLARVASPEISAFLASRHLAEGVGLQLGATVSGFRGVNGRIAAVMLGHAHEIPCDFAIVGVGAVPNDELASAAGLECRRGIVVDDDARSVSDPDIFAIGDVSLRPMPIYHRLFRLESVPNALEQAKQAASAICARPRPAPECPWQWSDQYDLKLQIAGYPFEADRRVVRGAPSSGRFAVFHLLGERLQAVEAVNAPDAFMFGRQVILNRARLEPALLADTAMSLKGVLAAS
jgi:3-phenylpropionate/trans-cinnamate dioxygenase ferredoxin reductase subunit